MQASVSECRPDTASVRQKFPERLSKLDPSWSNCCTCGGTMAGGSRSELGSTRGDDTAKRLGRYQIIGRLATGGMAEVYLALSEDLPGFRTLVVLKRILPHLASNSQFIRMFLDEARLAALLDHPNIVRIIEVGHD